jgi:hypothetical protein
VRQGVFQLPREAALEETMLQMAVEGGWQHNHIKQKQEQLLLERHTIGDLRSSCSLQLDFKN